jgi:hypothetical protein
MNLSGRSKEKGYLQCDGSKDCGERLYEKIGESMSCCCGVIYCDSGGGR